LKKNIFTVFSIIFLLTGFFNNSYAIEHYLDNDSLVKQKKDNVIEYNIIRNCKDSIIQDIENKKIFLYGDASIEYGKIKITASEIVIDWKNNTILAIGRKDSSGSYVGNPIFEEGNDNFKASEIIYNLKTKKCIVKKIITQEGEGYIHGRKMKKMSNNIFWLRKGEYTTCNADHPHFSIKSNKIKIVPNKQIVTGPAYVTFFNIPTPLFLPFGYFPNSKKKSSGIILPSYGESANLGFFLKDGGYYLPINNYLDLTLKADVYTKGSFSGKGGLRYKKRYKYNGYFNFNYSNVINSEPGFPDYNTKKDFFINWSHKQDPKSNPQISFSANVNAGTSTFHKNNTLTSPNNYLSNTFRSSINFSKSFKGKPYNISSNLEHNQNTQTNRVNLTLPNITFSVNKLYPLRNFGNKGTKNWYDNIGIRYTLNTKNQISTTDSMLFHNNTLHNLKTGAKHTIPINSSFKLFKYFTFTQSINLSERWYIDQIEKNWNGFEVITDTIKKFTRGGDYSLSSSINTKIFGLTQFKKGKIAAFRHVITPNLSFIYNPSFANEKYGFYKEVQIDSNGKTDLYSIMQNGIYGSPRKNKSGNIRLSINNILGLKLRTKQDSSEKVKKVTLIESFNLNSSYNIFADSFNFSNINLNIRTKLFNQINISYSSVFDLYTIGEHGRINKFELFENKRIARFKNSNLSAGININDQSFTTHKTNEKKDDNQREFYLIPWNLNINYSQAINKGTNLLSETINTKTLGFSGNLKITDKWKIGLRSGYDFNDKDFSYTSVDIYRDLHCWEMLFNWIPTGYQRSYTLTIRVKADILKDVKLERKRDWINPNFN